MKNILIFVVAVLLSSCFTMSSLGQKDIQFIKSNVSISGTLEIRGAYPVYNEIKVDYLDIDKYLNVMGRIADKTAELLVDSLSKEFKDKSFIHNSIFTDKYIPCQLVNLIGNYNINDSYSKVKIKDTDNEVVILLENTGMNFEMPDISYSGKLFSMTDNHNKLELLPEHKIPKNLLNNKSDFTIIIYPMICRIVSAPFVSDGFFSNFIIGIYNKEGDLIASGQDIQSPNTDNIMEFIRFKSSKIREQIVTLLKPFGQKED